MAEGHANQVISSKSGPSRATDWTLLVLSGAVFLASLAAGVYVVDRQSNEREANEHALEEIKSRTDPVSHSGKGWFSLDDLCRRILGDSGEIRQDGTGSAVSTTQSRGGDNL